MKKIMNFVFLFVCVFAFVSCTSVRKVKIVGEPGTIIEVPSQNDTYRIDDKGEVVVSLSEDYYHAYLLSTAPGSNLKVPFALNYRKNNSVYWKTPVGCGFLGIYFMGMIYGTIGLIVDAGTDFVGVSFAAAGIGGLCSLPGMIDIGDHDIQHKYKYLKEHKTNDDLFFVPQSTNENDLLKSINMSR